MQQYRLFVKSLSDNQSAMLTDSTLRITSFTIKRDLLTNANSTFTVLGIPSLIENGDIVGVYDDYGKVVYNGIVKNFDATKGTIECDQMMSIFDFDFLYKYSQYTPSGSNTGVEYNVQKIINKLQTSGGFMQQIFSGFDAEVTTNTGDFLEQEDDDKPYSVFNLTSKLYEVYNANDVVVDIKVSIKNGEQNTIKIGVVGDSSKVKQIGNNTNIIRNLNIEESNSDTNVIHIVNKSGTILASRYILNDGSITSVDSELQRPHKQLIKYVETTKTTTKAINNLINENLPNTSLNHKIKFDLLLNNKLIDFNDLELGGYYNLFLNDRFYHSALTGYEMKYDEKEGIGFATLTFGKVRQTLESRLYKYVRS